MKNRFTFICLFSGLSACLSFVACLLVVIFNTGSLAQTANQYTIEHYTNENGLPQNSVNAIAKDSSGFLWLGTESGLIRFDGHSFFVYDKTVLGTPSNRVRYFLPSTGKPGTSQPLFYACDGLSDYVGIYSDSYPKVASYPDQGIRNALSNVAKESRIHRILGLPKLFAFDIDTLKSPDLGLLPVGNDAYYFRHNGTIAYYQGVKRQFSIYVPENQDLIYQNGALFAVRKDGSLIRIERSGPRIVTLAGDILKDGSFGKRKMTYFWNNISHQIFVHLAGRLYRVNLTRGNTADTDLLLTGMDLEKLGVMCIYEDERQSIYLGCRTEGLYCLKRKQFQVAIAPEDSLGSVFYAIAPSGDNAVITRQGYRISLNPDDIVPRQDRSKLGHFWLWHFLVRDKQDNLWVAESTSPVDRRLSKYSSDGERLLAHWDVPGAVVGIYCDPSGRIWFETDEGVLYYISSKSTTNVAPSRFVTTKIGGINTFYRSGNRQLWLGTSKGLYLLDIPSRKITPVTAMSGKEVRDIYGIADELWLCTYGNGMYLYKGKRLTSFPLDREKYLSSAHCIVTDEHQRFWISTNNGLFVVSKQDLLSYAAGQIAAPFYYYFDKSSGFNTNEFNGGCQPCGVKLRSGNVAFPSLNGVVYFSPDNLAIEYPDKRLLINEIVVDGKLMNSHKSIRVERNFGQIQILVSTPYFGHKKNSQISYRVSNSVRGAPWIPLTDQGRIYLSALSAGEHIVDIRKINGFGKSKFSYISLEITVSPYWYETQWFALFLIILTIVVIYFLFRARAGYLVRKNHRENLLNNARLYGDIITSINHDVQTPMHYVIYSVEQINEHLASQEHRDAKFLRLGAETLSSLRRISTLTNNMLNYLKANLYQNNHAIAKTEVDLRPLISEIVEMFSAKIGRDNIHVNNLVSEEERIVQNPQIFSVILYNLIDNAIKVSKNGTITISIVNFCNKPQLLIQDSGKGMPVPISDFLMNKAEDFTTPARRNIDSRLFYTGGLGLIIVKDLCKLSGIGLMVESTPDIGTKLYLSSLGETK